MAAYVQPSSALVWLRVNHLINGLHKQISCKNCLYSVNLYFTIIVQIVLCMVQLRCKLILACKQFTRTSIEWCVLYYSRGTHARLSDGLQQ